jgi:sugar phosphate isomerase/epimerase
VTTKPLPVLGAAMPVAKLPQHIEWLSAAARPLEIQDAVSPEVLDGDWRAVVNTARSLLSGYTGPVGIHGPFINLTILCKDPKMRTLVMDRLRQGLEFAHELGATHMVVHSPFNFFGSPFLPHTRGHGLDSEIELVHATLDPLLPFARDANCMLVIENIFDTNSAPLLALIRSFNSPLVRMSLDTGHAFIKHQIGGPTPDQWALDAGELLGHCHLTDTDGQFDRHWRPGYGNINWYALFMAMRKLPTPPRFILELNDTSEAPLAAQWLSEQGLAR